MNEYRKAFEIIAAYRYWNASKPDENGYYHHKHFTSKFPKEMDLIEDLVERTEAIKPLHHNVLKQYGVCPKCNASVNHRQHEGFCGKCGHALDWEIERKE